MRIPLNTSSYIIGGRPARAGEFPWHASLSIYPAPQATSYTVCGGVIWDSNHIVTASHCLLECKGGRLHSPARIEICVAELDKNRRDGEICFPAQSWRTHPGFNPCRQGIIMNDIAVITFARPLTLPKITSNGYGSISAACHPASTEYTGRAVLSGFGRYSMSYQSTSTFLKTIVLPIWDINKCAQHWRGVGYTHICVGGVGGQSACMGDSGGPLVWYDRSGRATVIGVTSFGPPTCAQAGIPTVFTKISAFLSWINQQTFGK
ncbi:trypsin-1-like protein [Dinothrombium tinctorium]|uniref:Trypsin-1-like protein n=1 Tax=Dinothrombium tinctorium TaxID=1965070 RepID=A0A443QKN8_9ACAR|nr:trypsin-1-like protein [Dinothrombium tinctorium]